MRILVRVEKGGRVQSDGIIYLPPSFGKSLSVIRGRGGSLMIQSNIGLLSA